MPFATRGSSVAIGVGLVTTGVGLVWPNNSNIGWGLMLAGAVIVAMGLVKRSGFERSSAKKLGDINITAGDGNKFGNVGHRSREKNNE